MTDKRLASVLFDTVERIERSQEAIHTANIRHAKLYQGYIPPGFGSKSKVLTRDIEHYKVTKNIVRSVCDTATALIGRVRPKATFSTDGADWSLQQRAELLDLAMVGAFRKANVWAKMQRAFRDATILGSSAIKLVIKSKKGFVDVERVLIEDIIVDEQEYQTRDGDPFNVFQVKVVDKNVLLKQFPKSADLIKKAAAHDTIKWGGYRDVASDKVLIVEAWHREEGGGEGRHVIACKEGVLFDGGWKYDWFPFVFFHWSEPISGFYGQGLAELLCGRQLNINSLYRFIRRGHELTIVPRVFVDTSNSLIKSQLTNEIGTIIPTRGGKPPTFYTPQAFTSELYNWLNTLERGGFDEAGISMMSAANQLPQGIESAPAQREYSYKEGQRFAPVSQRFEDAYTELALKMVIFYKELNRTNGGSTKVTFSNNKFMRSIPWKDVDMENDQYEIHIDASSMDTLSPAGRIQSVIELSQTGWIDRPEGRALLRHPDLVAADEIDNAGVKWAKFVAMKIGQGADWRDYAPDGAVEDVYENYRTVRAQLTRVRQGGGSRELIDSHLQYLKACEEILNTKPPQPAPQGPAEAGAPTTQPMSPMGPAMPQDANMMMPQG